jgi:SH3 domain protein
MVSAPVITGAQSDTRYVTDVLILALRDSPGEEYQIIKTIRSDTPVQVLEEAEKHLRVRTEDGQEGWVAKQYITSSTPKPMIIAALNKKLEELKAQITIMEETDTSSTETDEAEKRNQRLRIQALETNLKQCKDVASSTEQQLHEVTQNRDELAERSQNVAGLIAERDGFKGTNTELKTANKSLKSEIEQLQKDKQRLLRNEIIYWFLAGSGVFFTGLLIGKFSRKKKRY